MFILTLPEGTNSKDVFNYLRQISAKRKILDKAFDDGFWDTHKLLCEALVTGADADTGKDLLTEALEAESPSGKRNDKVK